MMIVTIPSIIGPACQAFNTEDYFRYYPMRYGHSLWEEIHDDSVFLRKVIETHWGEGQPEILECGHGIGTQLFALQRAGYLKIQGIDISPYAAEYVAQHANTLGFAIPPIKLASVADEIDRLFGKRFDVLLAIGSVLAFVSPWKAFKEMMNTLHQTLNPHGILFTRMMSVPETRVITKRPGVLHARTRLSSDYYRTSNILSTPNGKRLFSTRLLAVTPEALIQYAKEAGFAETQVIQLPYGYDFVAKKGAL